MKRVRFRLAVAVVAALSTTVVLVGCPPGSVMVPNVVGQTQVSAESALVAAGLTVGAVTPAYSATVPSGNIVSHDPAGGIKVPRGTSVDLVVSTGPAEGPVSVPDVVGMTEVQAEVTLSAAGLTVGDVSYASSNVVAAGLVISQDPAAEVSVSPRTAVDILVPTVLKPSKKILL